MRLIEDGANLQHEYHSQHLQILRYESFSLEKVSSSAVFLLQCFSCCFLLSSVFQSVVCAFYFL